MMILRSSAASPFGRKVKIGAAILGFKDSIEVVNADTLDPNDDVRLQNPLGKIPVLILEDGRAIYDSRVILVYLDLKAGGGRIMPRDDDALVRSLTLQALADGVMDASILRIYELRMRPPELRSETWVDHQKGKVERSLAVLEGDPPGDHAEDVGAIALACALGYLDLRFEGLWRESCPRLVAWLDKFAARVPAFEATRMKA